MTIEELEGTYRQLHERLLRDELDEESFRSHVDQLGFRDDGGIRWRMGWYTGRWYRYDQGKWIPDTPRQRQITTTGPMSPCQTDNRTLAGLLLAGWFLL